MIGEERPGVDGPGALLRQPGDPGHEASPVGIIPEDDPALQPAHHDVVQGAGSIEARLAGDGRSSLSQGDESGNVPYPVLDNAR